MAGSIDSVKINTSLLMMRECKIYRRICQRTIYVEPNVIFAERQFFLLYLNCSENVLYVVYPTLTGMTILMVMAMAIRMAMTMAMVMVKILMEEEEGV